jgi:hypothetical protein
VSIGPAVSKDSAYAGIDPDDVAVINEDDDFVPLVIIPTGAASAGGGGAVGDTTGAGHFLDGVLPVLEGEEPPMAGQLPLTAVHAVGDIVTGGCQIIDETGYPTCGSWVHIYVYSVDTNAVPETRVLVDHWMASYDMETGEYVIAWDTSELEPGYYDLQLSFEDGSDQVFRIQLTEPVE